MPNDALIGGIVWFDTSKEVDLFANAKGRYITIGNRNRGNVDKNNRGILTARSIFTRKLTAIFKTRIDNRRLNTAIFNNRRVNNRRVIYTR